VIGQPGTWFTNERIVRIGSLVALAAYVMLGLGAEVIADDVSL
jgi:hypothetical protein